MAGGWGLCKFPVVFGNQVWSLQAMQGLCKPLDIFASLLESLKPSWGLCKLSRDFANLRASLPAMQGLCKPWVFFQSFFVNHRRSLWSHCSYAGSGENTTSFLQSLWQSTHPLQCLIWGGRRGAIVLLRGGCGIFSVSASRAGDKCKDLPVPIAAKAWNNSPHKLLNTPWFMLQEWDFSGGKSSISDAGSALYYQVGHQTW